MRRGLASVLGAAFFLAAVWCALAAEPVAKDSAPWHLARISKADRARFDAEVAEPASEPLKFLRLQLKFNPDLADRKMHKFRVVNQQGDTVGELYGHHEGRALLVFEREETWDSLVGLYLDGLGHREPLFGTRPVAARVPQPAPVESTTPAAPAVEQPAPVVVTSELPRTNYVAPPTHVPPSTYVPPTEVRVPRTRTAVPDASTHVVEAPGTTRIIHGPTHVVRLPQRRHVVYDRTHVVRDETRVVGGGTRVIGGGGTEVVGGGVTEVVGGGVTEVADDVSLGARVGMGDGVGSGGGVGVGRGVGAGVGAGAGGGPGPGSGSEQVAGVGLGPWDMDPLAQSVAQTLQGLGGAGTGTGAGTGVGAAGGSGAGVGGTGSGAGTGTGVGAGGGTGTGVGGTGSGAGTGTGAAGAGTGTGTAAGTATGAGPNEGQGMGPGEGQGAGPGEGQGMGPSTGPGEGQGAGPGEGQGMGPGQGQGAGPAEGQGMGPGESAGPGLGEGPGPGEGEGPGPTEGPAPAEGQGPGPEERSANPAEANGPSEAGPGENMGPMENQGPLPGMPQEGPLPGMPQNGPAPATGTGSGGGGGGAGGPGARTLGPNQVNLAPQFGPRYVNVAPHLLNAPDLRGPDVYYYDPEVYYYNPEMPVYRPGRPGYGRGYGGGGGGGGGGFGGGGGGNYPERRMIPLPPPSEVPMEPAMVLYISCGEESGPGQIFQVNEHGGVLGIVNLPFAATGLAMHREHGLVAAIPRDGGKLMRIDDTGKVSTIMENSETVVHPIDVGLAPDSDTVVVADNIGDCLAALTTAGSKPKIYHRVEGQKWEEQQMSVAVTKDQHVLFGTDGDDGIYRFAGDNYSASKGPLLPGRGGVAADPASVKWAATQSPDQICVFEGEELMQKLQLPANKSFYRQGLLSFGLTGAVVVAARDSDKADDDPWLIQYETEENPNKPAIRDLFKWNRAPMLDFVVGPRMYWDRNERSSYDGIY